MKQAQFSWYQAMKTAYVEDARWMARKLLERLPYVTTVHIWKFCPPPKVLDPRIMGCIFTDRDFVSIGFTHTTRSSAHRRPIQKYKLKEPNDYRAPLSELSFTHQKDQAEG